MSEEKQKRRAWYEVLNDPDATAADRQEAVMQEWNEALYRKEILENALIEIALIPKECRTGWLGDVVFAAKNALRRANEGTREQVGRAIYFRPIEGLLAELWDQRMRSELSEIEDAIFVRLLNDGYMGIREGVIFRRKKEVRAE